MLNILDYFGDVNQNDIEISPNYSHDGYQQTMAVEHRKRNLSHCW
jgi:hypothetical protein